MQKSDSVHLQRRVLVPLWDVFFFLSEIWTCRGSILLALAIPLPQLLSPSDFLTRNFRLMACRLTSDTSSTSRFSISCSAPTGMICPIGQFLSLSAIFLVLDLLRDVQPPIEYLSQFTFDDLVPKFIVIDSNTEYPRTFLYSAHHSTQNLQVRCRIRQLWSVRLIPAHVQPSWSGYARATCMQHFRSLCSDCVFVCIDCIRFK